MVGKFKVCKYLSDTITTQQTIRLKIFSLELHNYITTCRNIHVYNAWFTEAINSMVAQVVCYKKGLSDTYIYKPRKEFQHLTVLLSFIFILLYPCQWLHWGVVFIWGPCWHVCQSKLGYSPTHAVFPCFLRYMNHHTVYSVIFMTGI